WRLGVRRGAARHFLLLVALLEESHADLVAIDPGKLAAAVGQTGGGPEKGEFPQMKSLDGTLHGELGAGLGAVLHGAVAPPSAVDPHHVSGDPAFEGDTFALAPLARRHVCAPAALNSRCAGVAARPTPD